MTGVQQPLFPDPRPCPFCHAARVEDCAYEQEGVGYAESREWVREYVPRPKGCLAASDPATAEMPL